MGMDVRLAGFNVDVDGIRELKRILSFGELSVSEVAEALSIVGNLTPETISASYARISRDGRDIPELRADSRQDVDASRKSNKAIIFTMGHKSIAEHAQFNFDVMRLSRRAVEDLEAKRLVGYTEKSQRYITLDGDFVLPKEIRGTPLENKFLRVVELQNEFYKKNLERITDWHMAQDTDEFFRLLRVTKKSAKQGILEGLGKEDARYGLGLSTQAQVGVTISARNLESLIARLRSDPNMSELNELGEMLNMEVDGVAPSVIKYTGVVDYFAKTRNELVEHVSQLIEKRGVPNLSEDDDRVKLHEPMSHDESIIAGLIFSSSKLSYDQAVRISDGMSASDDIELINVADRYQEAHDPKLREYELGTRVFEMMMSSSAFAQMKRHRMNTLISQAYDPRLGHTTPNSVMGAGLSENLDYVVRESTLLYNLMIDSGITHQVAEYALTNAHRRRVLLDANNRQIHAICMERENLYAQWDIRLTANELHKLAEEQSPLTMGRLCGKHEFNRVKAQYYGED